MNITETIVAPATPPGIGGVGIVRISGPKALFITNEIIKFTPKPRFANFCDFFIDTTTVLDQGIAIYFCAPHSFTGEDVLELQCHGGSVVIDMLLKRCLDLGCRMARPGEFMERAFLNNKIDLIQAEAIADLITATSSQAAQNATRSMQGEFSKQVNAILENLTQIRCKLEATIDFPDEEEIEQLELKNLRTDIQNILLKIDQLQNTAKQGMVLRDGITVVIAGPPNAGKSSLFNYLNGNNNIAIVTNIPGTTRDVLRSHIQIDSLPINLLDTAGLREQPDIIEGEGIKKAREEIKKADHVLLVVDATTAININPNEICEEFLGIIPNHARLTIIYNKIDLTKQQEKITTINNITCIYLSVQNEDGLNLLKQHLKTSAGLTFTENGLSARRRHLDALQQTKNYLNKALEILKSGPIELAAEDLAQAQLTLGEITGKFTSDDLLSKIFSEFCIGK